MNYAPAAILLVLAACAKPDTHAVDEEIRINQLEAKVAQLQAQVSEQQKQAEVFAGMVAEREQSAGAAASAIKNNTAALLKDMTSRGACGYKTTVRQPVPGQITAVVDSSPVPCTEADLKK